MGKTYLAFDFWRQRFIGVMENDLRVVVEPGSVRLLALHAATGAAQLLSTSRHVTQGAIELEDVRWNAKERALHGVSIGPAGSAHDVFVYVPGNHPWTWQRPALYRHHSGYSLKFVDSNVVRVRMRLENGGRVAWKIDSDDLLG
jgi:hypothetical protein